MTAARGQVHPSLSARPAHVPRGEGAGGKTAAADRAPLRPSRFSFFPSVASRFSFLLIWFRRIFFFCECEKVITSRDDHFRFIMTDGW
jgi:hypothetical protein